MSALLRGCAVLLVLVCALAEVHAQDEPALSNAEVEILRDTAPDPAQRTLAFVAFLDDRTKAISKLESLKNRRGRDEDIHDLMEQFTSIADDFEDNLEEYGKAHKDLRKVLPKLVAATERWATALKTPPDNDAYKVSRQLALEALADLHESATSLIPEQRAWFLAHPPPKEDSRGRGRG